MLKCKRMIALVREHDDNAGESDTINVLPLQIEKRFPVRSQAPPQLTALQRL